MCLLLLWFQLFFSHFYCSKYGVRNVNENLGTYIRLARTLKGPKWIFKNICGLNWMLKRGEKKENAKFYCIRARKIVYRKGYEDTFLYSVHFFSLLEGKWKRKFSNFCEEALNGFAFAIPSWKCVGIGIIGLK